ncbi:extracellular solute-binding protein [Streptomyces sp. NPDC048845]|uniref:extracellular solute-binding protein n=1 Tax=Streptomyces sp. NPDC048845 TaxID=3155390 RepID=UPI00344A6F1F
MAASPNPARTVPPPDLPGAGPGHPRRRTLLKGSLAGAGAALAAGALSGCGSAAAADDPDTVRMWSLFSGSDGALLTDMVKEVRRDMPGIGWEHTVLEWGPPYYTKLSMAAAGGRAPDLAIAHLSRLPGYAPTGLLDPWDLSLLAEFGVERSDFAEPVWRKTLTDGTAYAIPLDTHPFVTFFHPDAASKAGLLTADGALDLDAFGSPERFLEASRELAKATGRSGVAFGYVLDYAQSWRLFYGLYRQTGGVFRLPPGGPAEIDTDRMTHVVEFMTRLLDGRANPARLDYVSALASFNNRQTGMILSGEWELPAFRAADPEVGGAPFPNVFGEAAVYADSHSFVLPRQKDPSEEKRRNVHRFVAGMLKAGQLWAQAGHIPAYGPVTRTAAYRGLTPQSDYAAAQEQAVFDPPAWFTGAGSDFQTRMGQSLQTALVDGTAPDRVARDMVRKVNTLLAKPDPA